MYTYGDMQEMILAKLDLTEEEAETQGLIRRFPRFADEAMTQICSAVQPNRTFDCIEVVDELPSELKENTHYAVVGRPYTMPADFISFGDDVNTLTYVEHGHRCVVDVFDDDFKHIGYNKLLFKRTGTYCISYNARWIDTFVNLDVNVPLEAPRDVLDCIPSYVASQCMKIDDEYKSAVYRNEYEAFLARIDDSDYSNTRTIKIGGDW